MFKYFLAVLAWVVCCENAFSQRTEHSLFEFTPPSPDAAALGRYGQIGTDKASGTPQITVPLYEIKTSRFTLPISLSYNASGVKVDEIAGWVGLSWSLNAGGLVSRTIVGIADGFRNETLPNASEISFPEDLDYLEGVILHRRIDTEPDFFFYNFNGFSGSFVFGEDNKPKSVTSNNLKIEPVASSSPTSSAFVAFKITAGNGDIYIFSTSEYASTTLNQKGGGQIQTSSGVSSWYLTQMISADRSDTIHFEYRQEQSTAIRHHYSYMQVVGPESDLLLNYPCGTWPVLSTNDLQHSFDSYQPKRLQWIKYRGGRVEFKSVSGRLDNTQERLESIVVSSCEGGNCKTIKSFKLLTDYFYSSLTNQIGHTESGRYRLKLTGVQEMDKGGTSVKEHFFKYNSIVPPPLYNFGQDLWGYYNGKTSNYTLLQKQKVVDLEYGIPFDVGDADRSVSPLHMAAGMLERIYYPTRGYSQFYFSPHRYVSKEKVSSGERAEVNAAGDMIPRVTDTFVSQGKKGFVQCRLRKIGGLSGLTDRPIVTLKNLRTNYMAFAWSAQVDRDIDLSDSVDLIPGDTYELSAVAEGNPLVYASLSVVYNITSTIKSFVRQGGGMRIDSIANYDADAVLLETERYLYGTDGSGAGTLLIHQDALFKNSLKRFYSYGKLGEVACLQCIHARMQYSSGSLFELSSLRPYDIGYTKVVVQKGGQGGKKGQTVYDYDLFPDEKIRSSPFFNDGMFFTSYGWRSGILRTERYEKWTGTKYEPVKEKRTDYIELPSQSIRGLKLGYTTVFDGCRSFAAVDYYAFDYFVPYGVLLPAKITETDFDPETYTAKRSFATELYYENTRNYRPTRAVTSSSDGEIIEKRLRYPGEMVAAGRDPEGIYNAMQQENIVDPLVESVESRDGTQTLLKRVNYFRPRNWSYVPNYTITKVAEHAEDTMDIFKSYDGKGNLTSRAKPNGASTSYLWGGNVGKLLAEVKNAEVNEIAYAGFENEEGVSWIYPRSLRVSEVNLWGKFNCKLDNGTITKSGLSPEKTYIISYRRKASANVVATNTLKTTTQGEGEWLYEEKEIRGVFSVTVSGTGTIDELRLYPKGALMLTYVYEAGVGHTAITDVNGRSSFFEYDAFGRLSLVRDEEGNIVKKYTYNYQLR